MFGKNNEVNELIGAICSDSAKLSKKITINDIKKLDNMAQILSEFDQNGLGIHDFIEFLNDYKKQIKHQKNLKHYGEFLKLWLKIMDIQNDNGLKSITTYMTQVNNMKEQGSPELPTQSPDEFLLDEIKRLRGKPDDIDIRDTEESK